MGFLKRMKKFLYGNIPYLCTKLINPGSDKITYYKYIQDNGYTHYPYSFAKKYLNKVIVIKEDTERGLKYVIHKENKKLYFPRRLADEKIDKLYKSLLMEQDIDSAHCYTDSIEEFRDKTIVDIGAAEGIISLDAIEVAKKVYLFECEDEWIEALKATFAPWKDKITIVNKYVSNQNNANSITLDHFFADKPTDNLFLKMDIEGMECSALEGAHKLFSSAKCLEFAICIYHKRKDPKNISLFLDKFNCTYFTKDGFFYTRHKLRKGIFRGHNNS